MRISVSMAGLPLPAASIMACHLSMIRTAPVWRVRCGAWSGWALPAAVPADGLLDTAAALGKSIAGQAHDIERVHHRNRMGPFLDGGGRMMTHDAWQRQRHRSVRRDGFARGSAARQRLGATHTHSRCSDRSGSRSTMSPGPTRQLVHQPPGHAVVRFSRASTASTPPGEPVDCDDPAGQHRLAGLDLLTHEQQAEFVKTAERSRVRGRELG